LIDGVDMELQYVHEDDVVDALTRLLLGRHGGIFNLTGDGTLRLSRSAQLAGLKARRVPYGLYRRIATAMWRMRVPRMEAPPGQIDFSRYPWIASNAKIKRELGWTPRYTSAETFEIAIRARRAQAAPVAKVPQRSVPVAGG
jgi:UDP-glucose 4-epimerase